MGLNPDRDLVSRTRMVRSERASTGASARGWSWSPARGGHGGGCQGPELDGLGEAKLLTVAAAPEEGCGRRRVEVSGGDSSATGEKGLRWGSGLGKGGTV